MIMMITIARWAMLLEWERPFRAKILLKIFLVIIFIKGLKSIAKSNSGIIDREKCLSKKRNGKINDESFLLWNEENQKVFTHSTCYYTGTGSSTPRIPRPIPFQCSIKCSKRVPLEACPIQPSPPFFFSRRLFDFLPLSFQLFSFFLRLATQWGH